MSFRAPDPEVAADRRATEEAAAAEQARFVKAARRRSVSLRSVLVYFALLVGLPIGFGVVAFLLTMHDGLVAVPITQLGALVGLVVGVLAVLVRWIWRRTSTTRA